MQHLLKVEQIAITALSRYNLTHLGWSFAWDRAKRRFGSCDFTNKRITLSKHLARINSIDACRDTILHEVAHALAGRNAGHGPKWIEACLRVGARPERCYTSDEINTPPSRYVRYCPSCFRAHPLHRKSKKKYACGACCRAYNNGLYSKKYLLRTAERTEYNTLSEAHVS